MCMPDHSKEIEEYMLRDLQEKLPRLLTLMTLYADDLERPDLPKCFCGATVHQKGVRGGEIYCPKCGRKF